MYGFESLLEKSLPHFGIFKVYDEKCGKKRIILLKVCTFKKNQINAHYVIKKNKTQLKQSSLHSNEWVFR